MAIRLDLVSEESFMENEESEAKLATGKTQGFVLAIFRRKSAEDFRGGFNSLPVIPKSTVSRVNTVVWSDSLEQLSASQVACRNSGVAIWRCGDLQHYGLDESALSQCQEADIHRIQAGEALFRLFWQTLVGKVKVRPASASVTHIRSLLLPETKTVAKMNLSPSVVRTRRSAVRYCEPLGVVSTPVISGKKLSNFSLYSTAPNLLPLARTKSSSKKLARTPGNRLVSIAPVMFPELPGRSAFASDFRGQRETANPVYAGELKKQMSTGVLVRTLSKPGVKKKGLRGKLRAKGGVRLRATPYQ